MEYKSGAVHPGENVSEGWNLIKDSYWTFFGMTLVAMIILIVAGLILGTINNLITLAVSGAFGVATQNSGDVGKMSAAIVPQLISVVISFFTNIILLTFSGALFCGIYSALARKADTGVADFSDLFSRFQKLMPCLIAAVIVSLIQFAVNIALLLGGAAIGVSALGLGGLMNGDGQGNPAAVGGLFAIILGFLLAYIVINIIVSALTTFIYPLLAERNLSGMEAVTLSFKGGFANIGGMILLLILLALMSLGGFLVFCFGIFFVIPVVVAAIFSAFRNVFGKTSDFRQYNPPSPPVFNDQPNFR